MARHLVRLAWTLALIGLGGALGASAARAEIPKLISYGSFSPHQANSVGVAVDQSSHDVYVAGAYDLSNPSALYRSNIEKFDATGNTLLPPAPFGEGYNAGVAVDPTNGHVDVLLAGFVGPSAVDTYDPGTGALLSSFPVPASENRNPFTIVQIATDSAGNVYVPEPFKQQEKSPPGSGQYENAPDDEVLEYPPGGCGSAPPPCPKVFTGSGHLKEPSGVSVDPSGNVWVADTGNNRIEELSSADVPLAEIASEGVESVALDGEGDVFAIVRNNPGFCGSAPVPCRHLVEYGSGGKQVADVGAGSFGPESVGGAELPMMPAVNQADGRVYVADGVKGLVWVYGRPTAPIVENQLSAEVGSSQAKLGALVNPGGLETSYRFEYLSDSAFKADGESFSGADASASVPFPEGNVGQGVVSRTVWASANGLAPGTTYHYRVVATNEAGSPVVGPDQTFTTETAEQAGCPNEQLRGGFSANLPDCRAYELVTPPTNTSTQPDTIYYDAAFISGVNGSIGTYESNNAARDGDRMSYTSVGVQPGSQSGGLNYVATRATDGWSSEDVIPAQSYTGQRCSLHQAQVWRYSVDLASTIVTVDGSTTPEELGGNSAGCGAEGSEVVKDEPLGVENMLLRDNTDGGYRLVNPAPLGATPTNPHFHGASSDLRRILFDEEAPLTPEAPAGADNLYEWADGAVRLASVLPDGTPAYMSPNQWHSNTAVVSSGGTDVIFTSGSKLYVRVHAEREQGAVAGGGCTAAAVGEGKACTFQVDASQAGGGGGGGRFWYASEDGSRVFFTDEASAGLTADTMSGSGENLYEYDVRTGRLVDLTPAAAAAVTGVVGISEDGSYVYFVAGGGLAAGAATDQPNLYLAHGGTTTFIATLRNGGEEIEGSAKARVSPNGAFVVFTSEKSLTGYGNTSSGSAVPSPEIFLYSASSSYLSCVSCNPSGEPPVATGATVRTEVEAGKPTRYVTDSGRVIFDTSEPLLPSDTNGQLDVYEYESGQLHLISTGTSSSASIFLDMSESGNDAFFIARQKLVPQETEEEALAIYDARVDGGFAVPGAPPSCATADACRTPVTPQPSIYGAPSSQTFSGVGNVTPLVQVASNRKAKPKGARCRRGFVNRKGRCVVRHERKGKKKHRAKKGSVRS